ncbi:YihY/virulence factor BrkB family protein [Fictibacillus sp. WQ 8-8]|uniref:YihY/virulence factor BrkB family protein n=1 Tax=Fictibacillus sp. WQ 8-8 TaxID=2938788 RepID=UPI0008EE2080|nr:YihY/virulence factor BrkB family protein [Fictibacillus sp. WQ 8-8]MCQ6267443.1 YihY/virulence factor BrkB family protein [Fictibacillus sp. WQ 8-8]SFE54574.1 membrane protein [Bacillus sp. OV194]
MKLFHELKNISPKSFAIEFMHSFKKSDVPDLAAQLAYYFLLSLFPFLIFLITLGGIFISPEDAVKVLNNVVPGQSMELIRENLKAVLESKKGGLLSFGIIASLWSASNGVNAVIKALNEAYGVEECRSFITARILAIFLTIGLIISIVVSLVLPVFGKMLGEFIFSYLGLDQFFLSMWSLLRWVISFVVIAIVFSVLYFMGPCKRLKYREVWCGAIFSTVAWLLVSLCFAFYVDSFGNYSATYGSLGAIIVLMLWFYLTGMVVILGGVINATFHKFKIDQAYEKGLLTKTK